MQTNGHTEARKLHSRLSHPVIDADGHWIEYAPIMREEFRRIGGEAAAEAYDIASQRVPNSLKMTLAERRRRRVGQEAFWGSPCENVLDRATAMLPRLMYERLDDLGIDFSVVYPTAGLQFVLLAYVVVVLGGRVNAAGASRVELRYADGVSIQTHLNGDLVQDEEDICATAAAISPRFAMSTFLNMVRCGKTQLFLILKSFSMLSVAGLSRLMALATPPTARFWMLGVFAPRIATTWLTFLWYSSAWR